LIENRYSPHYGLDTIEEKLSAYNAGAKATKKHQVNPGEPADFKETKNYVDKIKGYWSKFKSNVTTPNLEGITIPVRDLSGQRGKDYLNEGKFRTLTGSGVRDKKYRIALQQKRNLKKLQTTEEEAENTPLSWKEKYNFVSK
jgi:hypothetical protein